MKLSVFALVAALAWPAVGQVDTCPPLFPSPVGYFGPPSPNVNLLTEHTQIVRADFDADGVVDFSANVNNEVWVLPGRSASCMAEAYRALVLPGVSQIRSMVGADFDGDGRTDLALCTVNSGGVFLARGLGEGRFSSATSISASSAALTVHLARLDADALPDLAVFSDTQLQPFRGDPVFGLLGSAPVALGGNLRRAAAADFNADGFTDFACTLTDISNRVVIYLGVGTNGVTAAPALTAAGFVSSFALGDCDDDGNVDVVYQIPGFVGLGSHMRCFRGQGNGLFNPSSDLPIDVGAISALECRDVDADGDDDFLLLASLHVATSLQTSPGVFASPVRNHIFTGFPGELSQASFVDHDGDGALDIVAGGAGVDGGAVGVYFGDGAGRFGPQSPTLSHVPAGVEPGDFDLDGDLDLVLGVDALASGSVNGVVLALNDGAGGFAATSFLPVGSGAAGTSLVQVARIDADALPDLVVGHTGGLTVMRNTGAGFATFASPMSNSARAIAVADIDGDGDSDVLFVGNPGDQLDALRNDGAGTLTVSASAPARLLRTFVSGDWNGDGASDLAIAHSDPTGAVAQLSIHIANGAGGFAAPQVFARDTTFSEVVALDFDEDGDLDVACRSGAGALYVWDNLGAGVFAAGVSQGALEVLRAPRPIDFDADGDTDIVGFGAWGMASIQERRGDGAWVDTTGFLVDHSNEKFAPAVFDADGDGDLDIVTAGGSSGGVFNVSYAPRLSVLLNARAPVAIYCSPKSNSLGCSPAITHAGQPSASSASPFTIGARLVLNRRSGLMFYGFAPSWSAFQGGTLCISTPTRRTPPQDSGGSTAGDDCTGVYAFDFNARIQAGVDPMLVAGQRVFAQYWMRDPASASTTNLSDGVAFVIGP